MKKLAAIACAEYPQTVRNRTDRLRKVTINGKREPQISDIVTDISGACVDRRIRQCASQFANCFGRRPHLREKSSFLKLALNRVGEGVTA